MRRETTAFTLLLLGENERKAIHSEISHWRWWHGSPSIWLQVENVDPIKIIKKSLVFMHKARLGSYHTPRFWK
jgi:hypothetical protein